MLVNMASAAGDLYYQTCETTMSESSRCTFSTPRSIGAPLAKSQRRFEHPGLNTTMVSLDEAWLFMVQVWETYKGSGPCLRCPFDVE